MRHLQCIKCWFKISTGFVVHSMLKSNSVTDEMGLSSSTSVSVWLQWNIRWLFAWARGNCITCSSHYEHVIWHSIPNCTLVQHFILKFLIYSHSCNHLLFAKLFQNNTLTSTDAWLPSFYYFFSIALWAVLVYKNF